MAENDPTLTPIADLFSLGAFAFSLISIELQPELPRAVPITMKRDSGIYYLVGLRFETTAEAEQFATGLAGVVTQCDRDDGARLLLKNPPAITQDERGNCSGVN